MKKTFADLLPTDVRKSMARAELRRRGLLVEKEDEKMDAAFRAFYQAFGIERTHPDFQSAILALYARICSDQLSASDIALFESVPPGSISGIEVAEAIGEVFSQL